MNKYVQHVPKDSKVLSKLKNMQTTILKSFPLLFVLIPKWDFFEEKRTSFSQFFVTEKKLIKVRYCVELFFENDVQIWS